MRHCYVLFLDVQERKRGGPQAVFQLNIVVNYHDLSDLITKTTMGKPNLFVHNIFFQISIRSYWFLIIRPGWLRLTFFPGQPAQARHFFECGLPWLKTCLGCRGWMIKWDGMVTRMLMSDTLPPKHRRTAHIELG